MRGYLFIVLFLFSCATTSKYEARLREYIGYDIKAIIEVWGMPTATYNMSDGTSYVYLWVGNLLVDPKNYSSFIKELAINKQGYNWCKTTFFVNDNKKIINYSFEGNYCKAK